MVAKFNSKAHLQTRFFVFLSSFVRVGLEGKNARWVSKNAEFDADLESVEKVAKRLMEKKLPANK
jgi:hypothetical protein